MMERWNCAAGTVGIALLLTLFLPPSPVYALPPASGSKCNSNWVNNEAAMNCFVQGEEDVHNSVAHPHYVACTAAGEVFCCVDDNKGNQNCEVCTAKSGGKRPTVGAQIGAILNAQLIILSNMNRLSTRIDTLESKFGELSRKSAP